jgi:hypothetical protein
MRCAVRFSHAVGVAMVGDNQHYISLAQGYLGQLGRAGVYGFAGFDGGFPDASMPYHVGISEVETDEVFFPVLEDRAQGWGDLISAHFGLEVIGGYFGGGDEEAFLLGKGLFASAVEEVGDVGVLFGLGDSQLGASSLGDDGA